MNRAYMKLIFMLLCFGIFNVQGAQVEDKGYFLGVGDEGAKRLDVLNRLTNNSSEKFLIKMGLKSGMQVLELGCGTGQMSLWLAKQVLPNGKVIAVDNSPEQINLAKELAKKQGISNIEFRVVAAHDLESLGLENKLDMVFSRYLFIHLVEHDSVLKRVKQMLKPETGVIVIQDFIAGDIFSYPESPIVKQWLGLVFKIYDHYHKDPNLGKKLLSLYRNAGLKVIDYEYNHPLLKTEDEKLQMVRGTIESKKIMLENNLADEKTIDKLIDDLKAVAKQDDIIISFMPNFIIGGKK